MRRITERWPIRILLILLTFGFIALLIFLPLVIILAEALSRGLLFYLKSLTEFESVQAIKLTLLVASIAVPLNMLFGIAASWAITNFDFAGKNLLLTFIDLPFSVSPVIAGLLYVILLGANTALGSFFEDLGIKIIFALPGIVIATIFVTFPFVARELIPLMQEQGRESSEAAVLLGATGWQTFFRVTLPNIKWALLYGVLICNARAMGEFGAVSVVSGRIQGKTNTIPLQVEALYDEYQTAAAFSLASVLTLLSIVTLVMKTLIESKYGPAGRRL